MSHIPERKEKDCLNCGTIVQGRYCQHCGQENVVPKETFWHMVTHFLYDITHFDSSFFLTLKDLVFKPGFLSKEYMLGRRKRYLHPIKMYVFTSAVFFLFFFSIFSPETAVKMPDIEKMSGAERLEELAPIEEKLKQDSTRYIIEGSWQKKLDKLKQMKDTLQPVTMQDFQDLGVKIFVLNISGRLDKFNSYAAYDSSQKQLVSSERDGWFLQRLVKKEFDIVERYQYNPEAAGKKLGESILHKLPYMLFVSLPLFALLLKLLYIRRKQFYFADHGVFTIHLYIFSFILLLVVFSIIKLRDYTGWNLLYWLMGLLFLLLFFYLYRGMRVFYGQRRAITFLKFVLLALFSLLMMLILFVLFSFFSAVTL